MSVMLCYVYPCHVDEEDPKENQSTANEVVGKDRFSKIPMRKEDAPHHGEG